jgi:creatinine amidohydrolase
MANVAHMNWMEVEDYLQFDNRCVLPLGSTEQHAYLSLATDALLAERVSLDAAEPLGVPVFPVIPYGVAPYFTGYPGTISISVATYVTLVNEVLENLFRSGFRRILIVSGHGGNAPAGHAALDWMAFRPEAQVRFHEWWRAPRTAARVREIDEVFGHASWMEAFPWTRVKGVSPPAEPKPPIDGSRRALMSPEEVRVYLGDGNFGGDYSKPDELMDTLWTVAVEETRELLEEGWG